MTALLTYLTAVERLAAAPSALPPDFARAMGEDLEYARFGAALPDLPAFGGLALGSSLIGKASATHFGSLFATREPLGFALKTAELVANGALVGTEAGLAFLAGYVTTVAVRQELDPIVRRLVESHRGVGESDADAAHRIRWVQSLYFMQELHGSVLVGTSAIRLKLQLRKGALVRGVGRGLYEVIRVSALDAWGVAPRKVEVDSWMRGLLAYSLLLSAPPAKYAAFGMKGRLDDEALYKSADVDVWRSVDVALGRVRGALGVLTSVIRRGSFSGRARERLAEAFRAEERAA